MTRQIEWLGYARGIAGAVAGGAAGYFLFFLILRQGFYALALPGALVGLGCGYLSGRISQVLGAICAVAGGILAVTIEWSTAPFRADPSLSYFVSHLHKLPGLTQFMIALSVVFGFWFGRGNRVDRTADESEEASTPS